MNGRQFAKFLARDLHCPCGCVGKEDTFIPQHRAGRGIGGSKLLDRPSNIIVMCSQMNTLLESDATQALIGRRNGWKLNRWQVPEEEPFYDYHTDEWYLIGDDFSKTIYREAA